MKRLKIITAILGVVIIGGATWSLYRLNNPQAQPQKNQSVGSTQNATTQPSDDEKIQQVAQAYCENQKDDAGVAYTFVMGTSGPSAKKVLYSSDRTFASINVHCAPASERGGGTGYILKKTVGNWSVISVGTQPNPADIQKYNIPTDFN